LVEHGLATPEQLGKLQPNSDSVIEGGIRFTGAASRLAIVQRQPHLLGYVPIIVKEVEIELEMKGLAVPASHVATKLGLRTIAPSLYIGRRVGGLEIGIVKAGDHSEARRQAVAFFPWAEVGIPQWKNGRASQRKRDQLLLQNAWTREPREPGDPQRFALIHKYARSGQRCVTHM